MKRIWPWLRLLLGVAILVIPVWRLGLDAFLAGIRLIDGAAMLAALGIGLLTTVLYAGRWCLIARRLGLRLPFHTAIVDYYRSIFLNAVLPVGVLGDADRAVRHGRASGDLGRGVRAVVFERFGGQVVLLAVGVVVLVALPPAVPLAPRDLLPGPAGVVAAVVGLAAVVALAGWAWRRGSALLADTWADLRAGLLSWDVLPGVLLFSAAALAGHLALFLVAARTAGASAPITELLPLLTLALLAMALPMNIGGWGPREALSAVAFGAAGLGSAQGLTVAVTYGMLALVGSLPGAVVVALPRTVWSGARWRGAGPRPVVRGAVPAGTRHPGNAWQASA